MHENHVARATSDADFALFAAPGVAEITRLSAVETVRARILLSVEHGLLAPGTRLPRNDLIASGLNVSTITARRALESLVEDGLLVRRPGRSGGTFVSEAPPELQDSSVRAYRADHETIRRLIDQRSLAEAAIMHQAALNATSEQCDELEHYIGQSQRAGNWLEHHVPDRKFHHLCAEISALPEVPLYISIYEALLKYFVPYPMHGLETSNAEHLSLVSAFRAHDPIAAVAVTRTHVDTLRREMFVSLPQPARRGGSSLNEGGTPRDHT